MIGHLAALCALFGLAVPAVRAVSSPAFRRVFPFDARRIGVVTGAYLGLVAALALVAPRWLYPPAALATVILLFVLWRARPGYGGASGLPPGSCWPLTVLPWSDPEFFAKSTARYGPVFKSSQFGRPMACVVGLDRINRMLMEYDDALEAPPLPFSRFIEGGYLRYLPEETHARYRKSFYALFHSPVLGRAESRLAEDFRRGLMAMAHDPNELPVRHYVMRMMFEAWAELFFGIGAMDADALRLKALCKEIDVRRARWASPRRVRGALAEIETILTRRVGRLRKEVPPESFLAELAQNHPEALADRTILGNLIYIMQVTWGDVSGLLTWIVKKLSDHPEWKERLARELATQEHEKAAELATHIVLETLRFEQSEHRYRRTTTDVSVDEFRIPAGWLVRMCIRESHRDGGAFRRPERFDPDRFSDRAFTRNEYAPFGGFRLACIGEELTKTVGRLFVCALVGGFEWRVAEDGPPAIDSWAHNAPSARFRVQLTPKTGPA